MAYLILVRHGKSEWNALGLWTGWRDVELNAEGHAEARAAGEALRGVRLDVGYTSKLKRAQETLPDIQAGKNVIVAAHGNSLRALVKHLEDIPDAEIPKLEIGTGEVYVYQVGANGKITSKE